MNRRVFSFAAGLLLAMPAFAQLQVPRPAPEFVIRMVDGKQQLLSQYKGKVIALEFLQTTCPHCQNCSALLNKMYAEYGSKGFQPLGVAFNDMAALLVPDYVRSLQLNFPVGVASRAAVMSYLEHPETKILYVPQLLFIDREGMIRAYYPGGDDFFKSEEANMRAKIEELLKGKPGRASQTKGKPGPAGQKAKSASLSAAHTLK